MPGERTRYWQEDGKWFREVSFWHEDTQNCSTAVVREIPESKVPAKFKPAPPAAEETPAVPTKPKRKQKSAETP